MRKGNGIIHLRDMISKLPPEKAREVIREFYDDAYELGYYNPNNSFLQWQNVIDAAPHSLFQKGLDIGCGVGRGIKYAVEKGYEAYGCDISKNIGKFWKDLGISERCRVCPATNLPYEDGEFDLVLCMDVLEHIPEYDIHDAISEMERVGSRLFIVAVALVDERQPVAKRITTHITIRSASWWKEQFRKVGIQIRVDGEKNDHWWFYGLKRGIEGLIYTREGSANE
jgi:SAM-dependent methyltransferase